MLIIHIAAAFGRLQNNLLFVVESSTQNKSKLYYRFPANK